MVDSLIWILIDIIFMILNYIEYKKFNKWYNYFFVIVFFIWAMFEIYLMNN